MIIEDAEARRLIEHLASSDEDKSDAASSALHSFVLEATEQAIWGERRPRVLDTIESGLAELLSDLDDLEARKETKFANSVICIVKAMTNRAESIVPVLSKVFLLADPETSWLAADALALIAFSNANSNASDVLVSGTGTEYQPSVRRHAVETLGLLGRRGVGAQPVLRTLLKDTDREVRRAAVSALRKQRELALPAVPDLLDMLREDSELADCLQTAVETITREPSPISRPRKVRVHDLGQAAYDEPIYERGWTINLFAQRSKPSRTLPRNHPNARDSST
jgi:HEAT repeat protein